MKQKPLYLRIFLYLTIAASSLLFLRLSTGFLFMFIGNKKYTSSPTVTALSYTMSQPYITNTNVQYFNLGQGFYAAKQYDKAEQAYSQALAHTSKTDKKRCNIIIQLVNAKIRPFENELENKTIKSRKDLIKESVALLEDCLSIDSTNTKAKTNQEILKALLDESSESKKQPDKNKETDQDKARIEEIIQNEMKKKEEQRKNDNFDEAQKVPPQAYDQPYW